MNWGYKIAIAYSVFVILILALVYMSTKQNIDLVTEEYYEEEIKYQQQIKKQSNAGNLEIPIKIDKTENQIIVQFPDVFLNQELNGNLYFYRPDDKKKDQIVKINLDADGRQYFNLSDFSSGFYRLKMEWTVLDIVYYQEEHIFI